MIPRHKPHYAFSITQTSVILKTYTDPLYLLNCGLYTGTVIILRKISPLSALNWWQVSKTLADSEVKDYTPHLFPIIQGKGSLKT